MSYNGRVHKNSASHDTLEANEYEQSPMPFNQPLSLFLKNPSKLSSMFRFKMTIEHPLRTDEE
jgi:hypothetical protein